MTNLSISKTKKELIHTTFSGKNIHAIPMIKKVVLNCRVPNAKDSPEALSNAEREITQISGQKPRLCRAKKSIANFKLRAGDPLALKVTLRGDRMFYFLDKLFNLVLPRLRDFKGLPDSSFDHEGSYNITIRDLTYFPEVDLDKVTQILSIQITICTSVSSKQDAKMLLSALGLPFEKNNNG